MQLRIKLTLSFFCVLVLTGVVGFSGWYGMNEVNRLMHLAKNVEDGNSMIVDARYGQLVYMYNGKPEQIADVKKCLSAAENFLNTALKNIKIPERIQNIQTIIEESNVFEKNFTSFVTLTQAINDADKNLIAVGGRTVKSLTALVSNAEKRLRDVFNEKNATTYTTLTEANNSLYQARLRALGFNMRPTPENASGAIELVDAAHDALNRASMFLTDPGDRALLQDLLATMTAYKNAVLQLTDSTLKRVEAQAVISKQMPLMVNAANKLTKEIGLNANEVQQTATFQLWGSMALCIFFGILLSIWLTRNVLNQLGRDPGVLTLLTQRVTKGDFDIDDGGPSKGVYASLVAMVHNLKKNIEATQKESERAHAESIKAQEAMKNAEAAKREAESARSEGMLAAAERLDSVVSIVSSASTELSAQIEQSEQGASEQAARMTETATAMEEMNNTVLEVARNAGTASEATKSARLKAEKGSDIVRATVAGIQQVQQDSLALRDDMITLNKHAQDISQIMGVISDIADQTNLLALNAAIEAARAGEAGRGFAVVADEVRKLAEKTMASTADVGNAIKAIQQSTDKSMKQMDATVHNIESTTVQAQNSGKALQEIVALVDAAADQVNAIATASEEQSSTSDEINRSITQVNQIAGENARAMQESSRAVSDLATQSNVLSNLVEELKKA